MLLAIRERIMGFLGWVILGLIFIAFAFWGLDSYLQSSSVNYAASVNDVDISLRQHDMAYQNLVSRARETLGKDYDRQPGFDEASLKKRALERLISDELFIQAADSAGFSVSDGIIAAEINAVDAFKQDGMFSKELYQRVLGYQGMSPAAFEWQLRRELIANQMKSGIALTATASDGDFARIFRLEGQQRRFDYLRLPASLVADQVEISDADLEDYYQKHTDRFMSREQARIQYIELNAAELQPAGEVDEEALAALYEQQSERYVTPEERRARHILVSTPDTGEQAVADARARIEAIAGRLDAGEDFASVAAEVSEDPGSAGNGGDLGFFGRGMMTPAFEEAVFALAVGERSEPVQTSFGFHIIELLEVKPEQKTPLAEVRDELVRELQSEELADLFYEKSDLMANTAFEQPDTLEGVAEALGIEVKESGWIGRDGGEGIGEDGNVVATLFSEDVLQGGNNSATIEIGEDHVVVLRVLEYQPAKLQPLEDVREELTRAVRAQKLNSLLEALAGGYMEELRTGSSTLADIAGKHGLAVEESPLIRRSAPTPERDLVARAFSLPPPDGSPVFGGQRLPGGDYVIVALHELADGKVETLEEEQRTLAERSLNRILGASDLQMVQAAIERKASVHVPEESGQ